MYTNCTKENKEMMWMIFPQMKYHKHLSTTGECSSSAFTDLYDNIYQGWNISHTGVL